MSVNIMSEVFKIKFKKPFLKFVLISIADCANHEGECYPSYDTIAMKCSVTKRHIMKCMKELEKMGYLMKKKRRDKSGRQSSNLYKIYTEVIHN